MKRQMTMPLVSEVGSLGKGTYKGLPGLLRTVHRNSELGTQGAKPKQYFTLTFQVNMSQGAGLVDSS